MSLRQPLLWGGATIVISSISLGAAAAPLSQWMECFNLRSQRAEPMQSINERYRQKVQPATLNTAKEHIEKCLVAGAPTAQLQQRFDWVISLQQMLQRRRSVAALEMQPVLTPSWRQQPAAMNGQGLVNLPNPQGATMP
ncbi:hypothetical protein NIES2134_114920 [Thermostichus vulcanus NIES-2134]|nr:hypothetical protein NIES2134_114920 [Thermostichus vulcanus NIES-2134]